MIVEALAIIGFNSESENAVENLKKASEILRRKYGVKLVIVPYNTWNDSISSSLKSLPIIYIGGRTAFIGRAPSVEEIVNYILKTTRHISKDIEEALIPAALFDKDSLLSAASI
ncbi:MAG: hypothetical protein QXL96_08815 [Ignisphaera sp.]